MTDAREEMTTAVAVLRGVTTLALGASVLPMLLIAFGMLAIVGQQCTPSRASHAMGDQPGIIAFAVAGYAVPIVPAILLRRSNTDMVPKAIFSLVQALGALLYGVGALGLLAIGTAC